MDQIQFSAPLLLLEEVVEAQRVWVDQTAGLVVVDHILEPLADQEILLTHLRHRGITVEQERLVAVRMRLVLVVAVLAALEAMQQAAVWGLLALDQRHLFLEHLLLMLLVVEVHHFQPQP
jgi:hypothetical protein